jgi:hypothetical protein
MATARIDTLAGIYFGSGAASCKLLARKGGKWVEVCGSYTTFNTRKNGFCALTSSLVSLYPKTKVKYLRGFHPGGRFKYEGTWEGLLAALPEDRREYKLR